jgi:hypothetical protein
MLPPTLASPAASTLPPPAMALTPAASSWLSPWPKELPKQLMVDWSS